MFKKLSTALYLLSLLTFAAFLVYRFLLIFSYTPDLGGIENSVIYFVQRILDGQNLYTAPDQTPYSITQYTPLYYLCVKFTCLFANISADDVYQVFLVNRLLGLLFNLGYIGAVILCCTRIFNGGIIKSLVLAVGCFIFLESPSYARPDSLYLLIFMLAVYFFLSAMKHDDHRNRYLVLCAFTSVLSFFSKQTAVLLPAVFGLWFIITADKKSLLIYLTAGAAFFIPALVLVGMYTDLYVFYQNIVQGLNNSISISWFWDYILRYYFGAFGIIWMLLALIVFPSLSKTEKLERFLRFALISLFIISLSLSLKWGSWSNYFTEWWTVLFLITAAKWDNLCIRLNAVKFNLGIYLLLTVFTAKLIHVSYYLHSEYKRYASKENSMFRKEEAIANDVKKQLPENGKVFNNLFSPTSFLNNFLFRQAVVPQFEIVYFTTYKRNVFQYDSLRTELEKGLIPMMITQGSAAPQFRDLPLRSYKLIDTIGQYEIYSIDKKIDP